MCIFEGLESCNSSFLKDVHMKKAPQVIHNNFVFTPIDKDNVNVAIISKRFLALTLIKKHGFSKTNNDHETYKFYDLTNNIDKIPRHSQYLQHNFEPDVTQDNTQLISIYWLPKLHKKPLLSLLKQPQDVLENHFLLH